MAAPKGRVPPGKIRLEVVTPTGMVLSELVDEFTATSVKGEFGVLPGHIPLLSALRIGLLGYRKGAETEACAIGTGFVEVADDVALVLTDRFITKDKIDVVQTRLKLKETDEQLAAWSGKLGSPEHQALIEEEQWQAAILTLYGDPPPPTIKTFEQYSSEKKEEEVIESADKPS